MGRKPDFIIIGAMKCGTTAVHTMLSRHPDVWMPRGETRFFRRFPKRPLLVGECDPKILREPDVLRSVRRKAPDAKLLVLLRDPVMRYMSHYRHLVQRRWRRSIAAMWQRDPRRARRRGHYAPQLRRVFRRFKRDQVLITFTEDLRSDTAAAMERIQVFLGLQPIHMENNPPPEYQPSDIPIFHIASKYYASYNRDLYQLLRAPQILRWSGCQGLR